MVAGPGSEIELRGFDTRPPGLDQSQQRFDDLTQAHPFDVDQLEDPAILLGRSVVPASDLNLAEQGRQRRPELMRGIAREPTSLFIRLIQPHERPVEPIEEAVEGAAQFLYFVARARDREPP